MLVSDAFRQILFPVGRKQLPSLYSTILHSQISVPWDTCDLFHQHPWRFSSEKLVKMSKKLTWRKWIKHFQDLFRSVPKIEWVLSWHVSHPSTECHGNLFSGFCCKQTNKANQHSNGRGWKHNLLGGDNKPIWLMTQWYTCSGLYRV